MPPAYVKPYVKRQKNDMAEASMIENIDYSNFKDKVAEAQGDFREAFTARSGTACNCKRMRSLRPSRKQMAEAGFTPSAYS